MRTQHDIRGERGTSAEVVQHAFEIVTMVAARIVFMFGDNVIGEQRPHDGTHMCIESIVRQGGAVCEEIGLISHRDSLLDYSRSKKILPVRRCQLVRGSSADYAPKRLNEKGLAGSCGNAVIVESTWLFQVAILRRMFYVCESIVGREA